MEAIEYFNQLLKKEVVTAIFVFSLTLTLALPLALTFTGLEKKF